MKNRRYGPTREEFEKEYGTSYDSVGEICTGQCTPTRNGRLTGRLYTSVVSSTNEDVNGWQPVNEPVAAPHPRFVGMLVNALDLFKEKEHN